MSEPFRSRTFGGAPPSEDPRNPADGAGESAARDSETYPERPGSPPGSGPVRAARADWDEVVRGPELPGAGEGEAHPPVRAPGDPPAAPRPFPSGVPMAFLAQFSMWEEAEDAASRHAARLSRESMDVGPEARSGGRADRHPAEGRASSVPSRTPKPGHGASSELRHDAPPAGDSTSG